MRLALALLSVLASATPAVADEFVGLLTYDVRGSCLDGDCVREVPLPDGGAEQIFDEFSETGIAQGQADVFFDNPFSGLHDVFLTGESLITNVTVLSIIFIDPDTGDVLVEGIRFGPVLTFEGHLRSFDVVDSTFGTVSFEPGRITLDIGAVGRIRNDEDWFVVAGISGTLFREVPEPGTLSLLVIGGVSLLALTRRRSPCEDSSGET
jgi:hypothetical protein